MTEAVPPPTADTVLADRVAPFVRDVPDWPQPGVLFRDITPLLADGVAFGLVVDALVAYARSLERVDVVAGIEARGFLLGAPVARALGTGFVPVRKEGKLPWRTLSETYELEYGSATVEIHEDAFAPGSAVLVVDDVLATGGTAAATARLVERTGATVAGIAVLMEVPALAGRDALPGFQVHVLLPG